MENRNINEVLGHFKLGDFNMAEKKAAILIKKFPDNYFLYNLFGIILSSQKKYNEAIENFQKAIKMNPNFSEAHYNLGRALSEIEKYNESIISYNKAIKINSKYAKAYNNLGNVLKKIDKLNESITCYQQSIQIEPDKADSYFNLGNALTSAGQLDEAIDNYNKAIKIDNNYSDAYSKLAHLYIDIGKIKDAHNCFQKLFKLEPHNIEHKINNALLLTPIFQSSKEIDSYRNKFVEGLDLLKIYKYITEKPANKIELNFFYLAYHNKNNFEIMKKLSKLFRQILPNINYTARNIDNKKIEKKIKVGFISQFLTDHTVGKIFCGLIKNMNKKIFKVAIFHTSNTKKSLLKNELDSSVNKIINLKTKIHEQQQQIEKENLDIIFYPDIGMSPTTYFLAFSRLAPVQITSWGHSETTGIDTIDYFLSSRLFEKGNANKKYSERLVCLSQFPSFYTPPADIGPLKNRSELKLPKGARLYGCPQSLFKIHPDFDPILAEILNRDTKGYIIFIGNEGKGKFWAEALKKRWSKNFPILNTKVLFTKNLSLLEFLSLSNCVDVLLIPLHFGGGNTSLEAMIFGTPSITLPEQHLRTNVTAAIYKQMKITNPPIVKNTKEYIDLAIKLAKNSKKNNSLRKKTKKAANKYLYNNKKALKEFEKFLVSAHKAAKQGKKIKNGYVFKN